MLVFLIILLCAVLYALPGLIATGRRHPRAWRIWLVDILLGFTVLGWLWSLREALRRDAAPYQKIYYRYNYTYGYGEKGPRKRFDLRQLPVNGNVGLAVSGLAIAAMIGTLGWQHMSQSGADMAAAATTAAPQGWTYTQESDDTGSVRVSTLMSDDADAAGDRIPGALIVRSKADGLSAGLKIDGQFTCSAAANGTITVRFDDSAPETLQCASRPAGDPLLAGQDMLFIAHPEAFIARANRSQKMTLSADVLGQGTRILQFSPQGLDIAQAGLPEDTTVAALPAPIAAVGVANEKATRIAEIQPVRHRRVQASRPAHAAARHKAQPDHRTVLHAFHPVHSWKSDGK